MLYLGIDQHAKQLTIDLGDESGDLVEHRKVSTIPRLLQAFLETLDTRSAKAGGFLVIVEVTGFNDYLLKLLREHGCRKVILVQPTETKKRKTDRRDARQLRDLLWTNRHRILQNQRVVVLRVVTPTSPEEAKQRQLTSLMKLLRKHRTQLLNRMHIILKKHNSQHEIPCTQLNTVGSQRWLAKLPLDDVDALERELLQDDLRHVEQQIKKVEAELGLRFAQSAAAQIVATTPGVSVYGSLVIASRLGDIQRFANGDSMANFVGVTPSCRNSDAAIRHGKVTKLGRSFIRHILCQALVHVLRKDRWIRHWYQRIKSRRGSNVARVAVMRRLVTMFYAMLRDQMPYVPGGPERYQKLLKMREEQGLAFVFVHSLAFSSQV